MRHRAAAFKGLVGALIACAILILPATPALAADDFQQINTDGFGAGALAPTATASAVLSGQLYLGTRNPTSGCSVWRYSGATWAEVATAGFGDAANVSVSSMCVMSSVLYVGTENPTAGAQLWSYNGSTWSLRASGGFGNPGNTSIASMTFRGSNLYMGTANAAGCEVWRYISGFTRVGSAGLGNPANVVASAIAFTYSGYPMVGTENASGCEVYIYTSSTWGLRNTPGFGDTDNTRVSAMVYWSSLIYLATENGADGTAVYYGESSWTKANADGFGSAANTACPMLAVWDTDYLFAGTANAGGFELWRYNRTTWVRTVSAGGPDAANTSAAAAAFTGQKRYIGTSNTSTGCEVLEDNHPRIASVAPASAAAGQTLDVTITGEGTHFVDGVSAAVFPNAAEIRVNSTSVTDPTHAVANVTILAGGPSLANRDVNVITADEVPWKLVGGFQTRRPRIYSFTPTSAARGQTLDVTISGSYTLFVDGVSEATFTGADITVNSTRATSTTTAIANITLAPDAAQTPRTVNVITGTEVPEPKTGFTVRYPVVTQVSPPVGDQGQTLDIHITGTETNFVSGQSVVTVSGEGITVNNTWVTGASSAHANITIAITAPPVPRDVNVITGSDVPAPLAGGLAVNHVSRIMSASPDSGATGQQMDVDIVGYNTSFTDGVSEADFGGDGVTVNSTTVIDGTHARANISIGTNAGTGWHPVNVVTGGETPTELTEGFEVRDPFISRVSPSSGARGVTLDLEITGAHTLFVDGLSQAVFDPPDGIAVNSTSVIDEDSAIANITIASDAAEGRRHVNVVTGDEVPFPLPNGFDVLHPRILSVSPYTAEQGGSLEVNIEGRDTAFSATHSQATFSGTGISVMSTTVFDSTHAVAWVSIEPDAPPGPRDVCVVTDGEAHPPDPLAGGFAITTFDPHVESVDPSSGEQNRTLDITLNAQGTSFVQDVTEVMFSEAGIIVNSTRVQSDEVAVANVTILPTAGLGPCDVWAVTGGQTARALANGFTVTTGMPRLEALSSSSGAAGDTITISGEHFGEAQSFSYVDFAGCRATVYSSWTSGAIQCVVPREAVSGALTVTTAVGKSNSLAFTMTNTPKGTSVDVQAAPDVAVEFDTVDASGDTTALDCADPQIEGYVIVGGTCRDVATTAAFSGNVRVTIACDAGFLTPEQKKHLAILHEESGGWIERTVDRGTSSATITAECSGFSRFIVAYPLYASTWYLAEGSTAWGFDCSVSIENPNDVAVTARPTFMTEAGPVPCGDIYLPARSHAVLDPGAWVGSADFSAMVVCMDGLPIAVDRTMSWRSRAGGGAEGHSSIGVNSPSNAWYLAEGSTAWGFECWLLIQNPNDAEARCTVTYMLEGGANLACEKVIPPRSRRTYDVSADIGAADASIMVASQKPVIAERAMYRNGRREGHGSIGVTSPSSEFHLAEGTTAWGFTTYLLVQNPNPVPADVQVTYMTGGGPVAQPAITLAPLSRKTIRVNDVLPGQDVSTSLDSDVPVVAERAMYWGEGTVAGEACHDSVGVTRAHSECYLPDGRTGDGYETWTLVQNPNEVDVVVEIQYLSQSGGEPLTVTRNVPAGCRSSFAMSEAFGGRARAGIAVRCLTTRKKILVERSMYWEARAAGTSTIGGYGD